jgi:hypothetical protein
VGGIHLEEFDILGEILDFKPFGCVLEHLLRQIDPGDLDVPGKSWQGKTGPDPDLEKVHSGAEVKKHRRHFTAAMEKGPEDQIVKTRIAIVNLLDVFYTDTQD